MNYSIITKSQEVLDWCEEEEIKCKFLLFDDSDPAYIIHHNLFGFKENYLLYTDIVPDDIVFSDFVLNQDLTSILVANNEKMKQVFRNAHAVGHGLEDIIAYDDGGIKDKIKWI